MNIPKKTIHFTIEIPAALDPSEVLLNKAREAAEAVFGDLVAMQEVSDQLAAQGITISAEELLARKLGGAAGTAGSGVGGSSGGSKRKRLTAQEQEQIVEKLKAGATLAEAAAAFGCSTATVMALKKKAGLVAPRAAE